MAEMNARQFAEAAVNRAGNVIDQVTRKPDGTPRDMPGEVAAGVMIAQSNMAIAAALLLIAKQMEGTQS